MERARDALEHLAQESNVQPGDLIGYPTLGLSRRRERVHDAEAFALFRFWTEEIRNALPPGPEANETLEDVRRTIEEHEQTIDNIGFGWQPIPESRLDLEAEENRIRFFVEELKLTACDEDWLCGAVDLLCLRIWRNLPQLYEVWVLTFVLAALEEAGLAIELNNIVPVGRGRVWNLNYSRATDAVAIVDQRYAVTFQLYDRNRRTMPDLALHAGPAGTDAPMLIIDPKFSRRGYTFGQYRDTANTYRTRYGAPSLIVEYFERYDIERSTAWFLRAMRPGQPAAQRLRSAVLTASLPGTPTCVLDASESYANELPAALQAIDFLYELELVAPSAIVFAGTAERLDLSTLLARGHVEVPRGQQGTQAGPLLDCMRTAQRDLGSASFVLFSDGIFQEKDALKKIQGAGFNILTVNLSALP